MQIKIYILDASAIIGGFYLNHDPSFTTNDVILEIKDRKSKMALQSAMDQGHITIKEPSNQEIMQVNKIIETSGDVLRLSKTDKRIIALALTLKSENFDPIIITDDYSIQNVLKIMNMPYKSVLTDGIKETFNWYKICKGCKKKYPPNYQFEECEICGSRILRKRIKKR